MVPHARKNCWLCESLLKFPWLHFRVNISLGPNEDRHLMSGLHTVNDIYCSSCQQILGWRYVSLIIFYTHCVGCKFMCFYRVRM